jgi:peptidoglycan/LPS O-acetylase OafA/YrhL
MTGISGQMRQATTGEVRLDERKAARLGASAQSTGGFDRLLRTRCAICHCPRRPKGRPWLPTTRNPGNIGWSTLAEKNPAPSPLLDRSRNLDLIRATAISMVLIYHAVQMSPIPMPRVTPITRFGEYGVDLFFILSGWLIGGLYWRERHSFGNVLIVRFWIRRWIRTIPPYLAALLLSWVAVRIARGEPFDWGYFAFVQNYYNRVPFFLVSWSLCVEEHFYLLVPPLFVLWKGNVHRHGCLFLAALAFMAPAAFRFLEFHDGAAFGYSTTATHLRMEGLILGFFLSYISIYSPKNFRIFQSLSPYILGLSLIGMSLILSGIAGSRAEYTLWGTAISLFFLSALLLVTSCNEIGAASRLTTPLAVASYSIYLTHSLTIHVARELVMRLPEAAWLAYFPVMLVIVAASSIAFYFGVEKTSISIRDWYWPRRAIADRLGPTATSPSAGPSRRSTSEPPRAS